jgi:hypothetical protein
MLALIAQEEGRLEGLLADHLEREEAEAAAAEAFDASAWGERLRWYESSNDRPLLRIIEELRKRHPEPEATTSSAGRASARAGTEPSETAADHAPEATGPADEETQADVTPITQTLQLSPVVQAVSVSNESTSVEPGPSRSRMEPRPLSDMDGDSAGLTGVSAESPDVPPSIDEGLRNTTIVTKPPAASTRKLAVAVLALFALLLFAGLSAASDGGRPARAGSDLGCSVRQDLEISPGMPAFATAEGAECCVLGAATASERSGLCDRRDGSLAPAARIGSPTDVRSPGTTPGFFARFLAKNPGYPMDDR